MDLARMGISMYGYPPSGEVPARLSPAMELVSHVSHIKTIHAGDTVSYGRTFTAAGDLRIATVPIGYADGYKRALSGRAKAFIHGREVPLVGRVCMDQIMFDVTGVDVACGDEVLLMGDGFDADDMARLVGTISYEILTSFTTRVPRVYV